MSEAFEEVVANLFGVDSWPTWTEVLTVQTQNL